MKPDNLSETYFLPTYRHIHIAQMTFSSLSQAFIEYAYKSFENILIFE